ncbi:ABC transporter ATP-binding protein [Rhodococcus sp. HNM0563]|uniref:ABC transporter ATP-binding protein n=1 Tax=unclassified Rhodococcus (in: high G+C Gram-positive bacteria) TaxID=192944 RepID=UPI00146DA606|nr:MULTISPECIES: ABC transporter ATP-binding protein [unclassified Rhodococcus (in: high G+C Gram-positive bacteria)]MCK0093648.1 ABC transporter ATP-binding protein/permease [Rhodococcus sp. F64268]NLU65363.1 ABC transporter ATP-binding protein [Rhodococcus sp. HNM0563]
MLVRLLRRFLVRYKGSLIAVVVLQLAATTGMLLLPSLNADLIDQGVAVGDIDYIMRTGLLMLGISAVEVGCSIGAVYFAARAAMSFGRDVRLALVQRVGGFSAREFGTFGAPSLITRNTNDVQQVQMLVLMTCTIVVTSPIMGVGGIIMALREDVGTSLVLAVAVPALILTMVVLIALMLPGFRVMQIRLDGVNRVLREQVSGIRVVRAFVRDDTEKARFDRANDDLTATALRVGRVNSVLYPAVLLIANVSTVAVVWVGGARIDSGSMQVGSITAMITYVAQILMAVLMSSFIAMMMPRASVCAGRILEVLDTEPTVAAPTEPVRELGTRIDVELRGAGFSYPGADAPVLRDISFRAEPGTTTAIIGGTGSGKSTLMRLIPRLIDVTDGQVLVSGVDVRRLDPEVLRSRISVVPQKAYLFSGTIADNLRYGRADASDDELWHALEVAQAAEFVHAMPDRLESVLSQGGTTVSGGQRQRLAIARALVRKPAIYLFDDAFSALDPATDARLRAALEPETRNACVFIVAQRVSTVQDADRIVVLDGGAMVATGTHLGLLGRSQTYTEIVESQRMAAV